MKITKGSLLDIMTDDKPKSIIPYIEKYLMLKPNTGGFKVHDYYKPKDSFFHPSTDTDRCLRWLWYEKKYLRDETFTPQQLVTFKIGHALHGMLEAMLADFKGLKGFPQPAGAEFGVKDSLCKGSIDFVIRFPDDNEDTVIEIKTMNSNQYQRLKSPLAKHINQVRVYLDKMNVKHGIILYIQKDYPHEMKEFLVERKPVDFIYQRWYQVQEALVLDNKELAPKCCGEKGSECKYCPYTKECWEQ